MMRINIKFSLLFMDIYSIFLIINSDNNDKNVIIIRHLIIVTYFIVLS